MEITDTGVLEGSFMDFTIPTEFARCALYYMPQYGHFRCNGAYDIRRETLDWLLLAFIRSGTLYFECGGGGTAPEGSVVLLDCRRPHRYFCRDNADFFWFHFSGGGSAAYAELLCEPSCKIFPGSRMEAMFQNIFARAQSIPCNEHLISADIHRLLGRLASPIGDAAGAGPVMPRWNIFKTIFRNPLGWRSWRHDAA